MTTEMKLFLTSFAALLEKHDVDFEVREIMKGHDIYCDGIMINMNARYDDDGEMLRPLDQILLRREFGSHGVLLKLLGL